MYRLLFVALFFLSQFLGFTQSSPNPFDLTHRLKTLNFNHKGDSGKLDQHYNPFDIPNKKLIKPIVNRLHVNNVVKNEWSFIPVGVKPELFFGLFIGLFILLALISATSRNVYIKILFALKNDSSLKVFKREAGNFYLSPIILLYLFWLINLGCFLFLLGQYYKISIIYQGRTAVFFEFISIISLIILIKHLLWYFTSQLFSFKKEMDLFHFGIILINILLGLILFPINIFLIYIPLTLLKTVAFLGIFAIISMYVYRAFIGLLVTNKFILGNLFHFLLYFCTVEIAPFVIILKYLSINTGIQ
ncbi:MAG TPA: DUF4271 domain-containing protein [Saprospiraceae bacterium]|nr:DUF4271 domain-containing protein [Saprospiraceae bacterium]